MLLLEKLILLLMCLALYLPGNLSIYAVVPVIAALTAAALGSWLEKPAWRAAVFALYVLLCLADPRLVFFLPLVVVDLFQDRFRLLALLAAWPLAARQPQLDWGQTLSVVLLIGLAWFLQDRGLKLSRIRSRATEYEDLTRDRALRLEQKNKALMEKQDYEVRVATLRERNRIARDIHDHVGHLLTRAILQLGAIQTVSRGGPLHEPLTGLKQTLDDSMTEIRRSLHDLHDASVDLAVELEAMVGPFTFCPVSLVIDLKEKPDQPVVLAFLAIVREGLSNIARHSNATQASLLLREHPGFYQLTLRDNGTSQEPDGPVDLDRLAGRTAAGIGLAGMAERVRALNGQINIRRERGFVILITVPRQPRGGK